MGVKMIAMTGDTGSILAREADVTLDVGVREEACPLGLAPTASTTACLAVGDAIAVALLERRGFREDDFASLHPAGSLGRRLIKVADLMHTSVPLVCESASMGEAIKEMTAKRLGITGIVDGEGALIGSVTDGDLRRALDGVGDILAKMAVEVM